MSLISNYPWHAFAFVDKCPAADVGVIDFGRAMKGIADHGFKPKVRRKFLRDNVLRIYGLKL